MQPDEFNGGRFVRSLAQLRPDREAHIGYVLERGTYFAAVFVAGADEPDFEVGEDGMGSVPSVEVLERELAGIIDLDSPRDAGLRDWLVAVGSGR